MPGDKTVIPGGLLQEHRILLGTYSGYDDDGTKKKKDYVMIGALLLPKNLGSEPDADQRKVCVCV